MSELEPAVRENVEELHRFFVDWFTGVAPASAVTEVFAPQMDEAMVFVSPDGRRLGRDQLLSMFQGAHGANPDFRIEVRDVRVERELGDHLLATYTEWQKGARNSARTENGRFTTVLMTRAQPFRWLHIHETWLPEEEQAAGPYDF